MMDFIYTYIVLLFTATSIFFTLPAYCSRHPLHNHSLSRIPASVPQIFCVLSYGAVGDGSADDTQPFKAAWDAACQADHPAVVLIPRHYTFMIQSTIFSGPCRNRLIFQIEGSLMAPEEPNSWPEKKSKRRWVVFNKIDGMTMHGGGLIDGRGHKWWELPCKPHRGVNGTTLPGPCHSPAAIKFAGSSNLEVRDLEVKNSPQFHILVENCRHVHLDSLHINSPAGSPNTDGIHVGTSSHVTIYNSRIATGDDCVSIGDRTSNVDIRNITCEHTHGISIGSLGANNWRGCVSNVTVRDSVIKRSDNGVRIKTWQGGYGAVLNITYSNIVMHMVRNPIRIDQYYCSTKACANHTSAVHITDISYTGIRGTYDVRSPPVHLACSDAAPCTNLTVSGVELLPAQGQRAVDPFCWNAYGNADVVTVPPLYCLNRGEPPSVSVDRCSDVRTGLALRGVEPGQRLNIVNMLSLQFSFLFFLSVPLILLICWGLSCASTILLILNKYFK